tara:strand:- start:413 stop:1273 length:861 start_codon:yes stop_codon:yes gene_type:complete
MKITVLGGSGFIGSHVADELSKRGNKVTIFDKKKSKWLRKDQKILIGDIFNYKTLEKAIRGSQIVYNFAALADLDMAMQKPLIFARTNILGTVQALNLCRKYKIKRFIHASSIYADSNQGGFYSCSKRASDDYVEEFYKSYKLNYTILRYGSVYGSRSDKSNGVRKILDKAIWEKKIIYTGSSKAVRKYINVLDAARASADVLKKSFKNKCIILTGHKSFKINEVLKFLANTLNIDSKIIFKNEKNSQHYIKKLNPYLMKRGKKFKFTKMIDFKKGINFLIKELKH